MSMPDRGDQSRAKTEKGIFRDEQQLPNARNALKDAAAGADIVLVRLRDHWAATGL